MIYPVPLFCSHAILAELRGHVAQRIEHQIPVLGVAGSTPAMLVNFTPSG